MRRQSANVSRQHQASRGWQPLMRMTAHSWSFPGQGRLPRVPSREEPASSLVSASSHWPPFSRTEAPPPILTPAPSRDKSHQQRQGSTETPRKLRSSALRWAFIILLCVKVTGACEGLPRVAANDSYKTRGPLRWPHTHNLASLTRGPRRENAAEPGDLRECCQNLPFCFVLLRHVWLLATPWTAAHQAPLSMSFPRQGYWSGVPLPSPGHLPHPGIEPRYPALQGDSSLCESCKGSQLFSHTQEGTSHTCIELPWWSSDEEHAEQCSGHSFDHQFGKILHVARKQVRVAQLRKPRA